MQQCSFLLVVMLTCVAVVGCIRGHSMMTRASVRLVPQRRMLRQQQQDMPTVPRGPATTEVTTDAQQYMLQHFTDVSCTSNVLSKQSCWFSNVCFVFGSFKSAGRARADQLSVVQLGGTTTQNVHLLQQQVKELLAPAYPTIHVLDASEASMIAPASTNNTVAAVALNLWEGKVAMSGHLHAGGNTTVLTSSSSAEGVNGMNHTLATQVLHVDTVTLVARACEYQWSFGHALGNCAMPLFLALLNHLSETEIPTDLQVMFPASKWEFPVLQKTLEATLTHKVSLLPQWLAQQHAAGFAGVCFRNLILGDGGYITTTLDSQGGWAEAEHFSTRPTFLSSHHWQLFRNHAYKVSGVVPSAQPGRRPLILLNDKRYQQNGKLNDDRRLMLDIDKLAEQLRVIYPQADVIALRFRDFCLEDQIRFMTAATVFITTPGSSSHMCVFMQKGSHVVVLGGPQDAVDRVLPPWVKFTPFDELNRWFPLAYVQFQLYSTDINSTKSYVVRRIPGHWEPTDIAERARWWRYNADVRVDIARLTPLLDEALGSVGQHGAAVPTASAMNVS